MFCTMQRRTSCLSLVSQIFLAFTFLCTPIVDSIHAIRMSQTLHDGVQVSAKQSVEKNVVTSNMPCHEARMVPAETSITAGSAKAGASDQPQPCCPYKQCSPKNCLMHFAIASMPVLEIIPHSPIDSRVFLDAGIQLVPVPFIERLRPPIS